MFRATFCASIFSLVALFGITTAEAATVRFSTSTIVEGRAEAVGVSEGDSVFIEIFADNGGMSTLDQSWGSSLGHYLGARFTIGGGAKIYELDSALGGPPSGLRPCPVSGGNDALCATTDSSGMLTSLYLVDLLVATDPPNAVPTFGYVMTRPGTNWSLLDTTVDFHVVDLRPVDFSGWDVSVVPLPASFPLLLAGLGMLGFVRARASSSRR